MSDTDKSELRKQIGDIKIARNTRTELFYTISGHDEFENIMRLIKQYCDQRELEGRIDELSHVKQDEVDWVYTDVSGESQNLFDRMDELTALKDKQSKED